MGRGRVRRRMCVCLSLFSPLVLWNRVNTHNITKEEKQASRLANPSTANSVVKRSEKGSIDETALLTCLERKGLGRHGGFGSFVGGGECDEKE